jgi:thioredoxin-like negative regulator of GroEL
MQALIRDSLLAAWNRPLGRFDGNASLSRALAELRRAVREDRLDDALRLVDRAWRCEPAASELFAASYARLLCLADREHDAALSLLRRSPIRTMPP